VSTKVVKQRVKGYC